jgi:hypothetical protein
MNTATVLRMLSFPMHMWYLIWEVCQDTGVPRPLKRRTFAVTDMMARDLSD